MYELPLFPLNTVLFPGMPLRLHIFEERYKRMIAYCQDTGEPFGVALIRRGREVGGRAEPHPIGCTARIMEIEPLDDGRLNLTAVGDERFQIHGLNYNPDNYLVGQVNDYPLADYDPERIADHSRLLRPWIRRYLQILAEASESQFDFEQLPGAPLKLAYLGAFLLQVPASQKQQFLTMNQPADLIETLRAMYRREVTLLQTMLRKYEAEGVGSFSAN
jgi:Lon protease-like protein